MRTCSLAALVAASIAWNSLSAQSIPVRTLTTPLATDSGFFNVTVTVRPLSNGSAVVNDLLGMRLFLFDAQFKPRLLADTSGNTPSRYPAAQSNIMPYLGDSTLLADRNARVFILVEPSGAFGRTVAPPVANDFNLLGVSAATDPRGRMVYRVSRRRPQAAMSPTRPDSTKSAVQVIRDSSMVVRADFDTRRADSVIALALPVQKQKQVPVGSSGSSYATAVNPVAAGDDWAMLSDGTIAVVRVGDYHIDFVHMDGTRVAAPKMSFDWKRITDEDKQRMIDSLKVKYDSASARTEAQLATEPRRGQPGGMSISSRGDGITVVTQGTDKPTILPFVALDPSEMPDYYPPIRIGTVRADQDGNVWILPTTSSLSGNGLVYDVVNGTGEIVERVKLPPNRRLLAVGKGGVVYMANVERGFRLERATIIR